MQYRDLAERIVGEITEESNGDITDRIEDMLEDYFIFKEDD